MVSRRADGQWIVTDPAGNTLSTHNTNAQAWRAADRLANEPISKREDTADWAFRKSANGGAA